MNPRRKRRGRGNPFLSARNLTELKALTRAITDGANSEDDNPRRRHRKKNIVHFPHTKRGRPRKVGRPPVLRHTGEPVFFSEFEKKKRRKKKKTHKFESHYTGPRGRGRPKNYDYWIADAYIRGILIYTYIGAGARKDAIVEAQALLGRHVPTMGKILGETGIIDKVELSGPYPREDGKPDPTWPRL